MKNLIFFTLLSATLMMFSCEKDEPNENASSVETVFDHGSDASMERGLPPAIEAGSTISYNEGSARIALASSENPDRVSVFLSRTNINTLRSLTGSEAIQCYLTETGWIMSATDTDYKPITSNFFEGNSTGGSSLGLEDAITATLGFPNKEGDFPGGFILGFGLIDDILDVDGSEGIVLDLAYDYLTATTVDVDIIARAYNSSYVTLQDITGTVSGRSCAVWVPGHWVSNGILSPTWVSGYWQSCGGVAFGGWTLGN